MSDKHGDSSEVFEGVSSGASSTAPAQCSSLRKNGYVVIKGHPCKIVEMSTSKTGKHGHAKVNMTGLDIFTGKKYVDICPSTHNMSVPNVVREEYQVLSISDDGYFTLLSEMGEERCDLKLEDFTNPNDLDEVKKMVEEADDANYSILASVIKAMDIEAVVGFKKGT